MKSALLLGCKPLPLIAVLIPSMLMVPAGCGQQVNLKENEVPLAGIREYNAPAGIDGQQWLESYVQAVSLAKAEQRPILIDFTGSDWCGWCIRLDEEVFSKSQFRDWAKENVVLLKLDFPQTQPQSMELVEQNQGLAQKYGIQGFPTILFINESGQVLGNSGYLQGGPGAWIEDAKQKIGSGLGVHLGAGQGEIANIQ